MSKALVVDPLQKALQSLRFRQGRAQQSKNKAIGNNGANREEDEEFPGHGYRVVTLPVFHKTECKYTENNALMENGIDDIEEAMSELREMSVACRSFTLPGLAFNKSRRVFEADGTPCCISSPSAFQGHTMTEALDAYTHHQSLELAQQQEQQQLDQQLRRPRQEQRQLRRPDKADSAPCWTATGQSFNEVQTRLRGARLQSGNCSRLPMLGPGSDASPPSPTQLAKGWPRRPLMVSGNLGCVCPPASLSEKPCPELPKLHPPPAQPHLPAASQRPPRAVHPPCHQLLEEPPPLPVRSRSQQQLVSANPDQLLAPDAPAAASSHAHHQQQLISGLVASTAPRAQSWSACPIEASSLSPRFAQLQVPVEDGICTWSETENTDAEQLSVTSVSSPDALSPGGQQQQGPGCSRSSYGNLSSHLRCRSASRTRAPRANASSSRFVCEGPQQRSAQPPGHATPTASEGKEASSACPGEGLSAGGSKSAKGPSSTTKQVIGWT